MTCVPDTDLDTSFRWWRPKSEVWWVVDIWPWLHCKLIFMIFCVCWMFEWNLQKCSRFQMHWNLVCSFQDKKSINNALKTFNTHTDQMTDAAAWRISSSPLYSSHKYVLTEEFKVYVVTFTQLDNHWVKQAEMSIIPEWINAASLSHHLKHNCPNIWQDPNTVPCRVLSSHSKQVMFCCWTSCSNYYGRQWDYKLDSLKWLSHSSLHLHPQWSCYN